VPSLLGDEVATNPFLRPDDPDIRAALGEDPDRQTDIPDDPDTRAALGED
jgi:Hydroxyacylglutathione hydrolase C-terminus